MTTTRLVSRALPLSALAVLAAGCGLVIGLDDFHNGTGAGGSPTTSGHGGGGGTASATACKAGSTAACYEGALATAGIGTCKGGTKTCDDAGQAYGPCVGQVLPATVDDCNTPLDENCDGVVNDLCGCTPDEVSACYTGKATTQHQGLCKDGSHTCKTDGSGYTSTTCTGEVLPANDDCSNLLDEDCSGTYCSQTLWATDQDVYTNADYGTPVAVATDSKNNIILVGTGPVHSGSATAGFGFVAKIDPSGAYLWRHHYGYLGPSSVVIDASDNIYFAGSFSGTIEMAPCVGATTCPLSNPAGFGVFVARLDSDGNTKWATGFAAQSGPLGLPVTLAAGATGMYVLGWVGSGSGGSVTMGSSTVTTTTNTNYLGKVDMATGAGTWIKDLGARNYAKSLVTDSAGNAYSTVTNSALTPTFTSVMTFDTNGNVGAELEVGQVDGFTATAVAVNKSTTPIVAGTYTSSFTLGKTTVPSGDSGKRGLFLIEADGAPKGPTVLKAVFGPGVHFQTVYLTATVDGGFVLTGTVMGKPDFGGGPIGTDSTTVASLFVAKLDSTGKHLWSRAFGTTGTSSIYANGLGSDSLGNLLVVGANRTGIDFSPAQSGSGNLPNSTGSARIFLTKFAGQ